MARLLEVKNLTVCVKKEGKSHKILDDISFTIDEGEILGLAGESGCGKSMTALSIANLLPHNVKITDGSIIFNNIALTDLDEKQLCGIRGNEISIVFQDVRSALNPLMKIGKQITETLELGGSKDKNLNKINTLEMLAALGFNNPQRIYNAYAHQLSGGMCQRIMTAIAVIRRPKLLLGDEPSSSLDEESQKRCLSLLAERNSVHKMSLLIISHDLSIIQQFCSRFLVMYSGKIIEEGTAQSLYSPLHPYTRALVNAIPHKDKRGSNLENIPGRAPSVEDKLQGCPFAPRCTRAKDICKESFPPAKEYGCAKVFCYFPLDPGDSDV
ncbi:MAG: ABC transporter ATP-binding protein [Treponema sp.]|nr:ABC transporter ATP-binding protein [Treponema sp.]